MTSRRRVSPPVAAPRPDPLMTPADVAALLVKSERRLREWRFEGRGPDYVRVEGTIRYRRSAVEAYIAAGEVHH